MKKIIACVLVIILIIIADFYLIDYLSVKKINLVDVYVASRTINPREIIKESDIKTIKIANDYVLPGVIHNREDIVGKITSLQGLIVKDSMFYSEQLDDIDKIPDSAVPLLEKNQVAFTLTNESGNLDTTSFVVGQSIDIYVSIQQRNEKPVFDLLLESVRIVSIKDRKGIEISSVESTGTPFSLTFAINQDVISILSLANKIGELEIYSSKNSYQNNPSKLNKDSKILPYLVQQ
ncbi:SAF domain-containing protein [Anaerorhabdus sp.]|uniref:SAF domain-containing protein n=1 Tax=Anaerorhabdus sp. TaxID=1872524 RepID=UPI002FC85681